MCENPVQYTREFILDIKSGEKNSLIKVKILLKLDHRRIHKNLKIIEKLSVDNIPNKKKGKGHNGKKMKRFHRNDRSSLL